MMGRIGASAAKAMENPNKVANEAGLAVSTLQVEGNPKSVAPLAQTAPTKANSALKVPPLPDDINEEEVVFSDGEFDLLETFDGLG